MTYTSLLIHNCYIGTATSSQNSLGEWTKSWTYSSTETKCRMVPVRAEELATLPGEFLDVRYKAFLASGASIDTDNRVRFESQDYTVRQAYHDSSHHHEVAFISRL